MSGEDSLEDKVSVPFGKPLAVPELKDLFKDMNGKLDCRVKYRQIKN